MSEKNYEQTKKEGLKAKVKSRTFAQERTDNYGTKYDFHVMFEGKDVVFQYTSNSKEPKYFNPGEEVEFDYTHMKGKTKEGKDWEIHKVQPVVPKMGAGKRSYFNLEEEKLKQKLNMVSYATSYAKDLASLERIKVEDIVGKAKELITFMHTEIDNIK